MAKAPRPQRDLPPVWACEELDICLANYRLSQFWGELREQLRCLASSLCCRLCCKLRFRIR